MKVSSFVQSAFTQVLYFRGNMLICFLSESEEKINQSIAGGWTQLALLSIKTVSVRKRLTRLCPKLRNTPINSPLISVASGLSMKPIYYC